MSELPPIPRDQRKIDAKQLDLLGIFHFIGAGLGLIGIGFLFLHYAIFHSIFAHPEMWEKNGQKPPPAEFFEMFKWFYLVFGIWFFVSGVLSFISGLFLRARKNRTFSMIVAAIICLHIPLGTVLGVFTIVVLVRDSVGELYEAKTGRQ